MNISEIGRVSASKAIKYVARKNHMQTELGKAAGELRQKHILGGDVFNKIKDDSGYEHVENIIRRSFTTSTLVDSEGGVKTYAKKTINSIYNEDGALLSREIAKVKNELYMSIEKSFKVNYFPDRTNSIESEFVKNGIKYTKIAKKGKPTVYLSTLPLDANIEGLVSSQKIHVKYAHLNKSSLKSIEKIEHHIEKNGLEQVIQARKTIVTKDGRTITQMPHNGTRIIVVSQPKVSTAVYKSPEDIKRFLSTLNDEIRNNLK